MIAEDLNEGDLIDLAPILSDKLARPWVWQPFGRNERLRREAIESARMAAEYEMARIEWVEVHPDLGAIIYTDQINVTVPHGYLVEKG